MRTIYTAAPFLREDLSPLGSIARSAAAGVDAPRAFQALRASPFPTQVRLGQAPADDSGGGLLQDLENLIKSLGSDLDGVIAKLPVESAGPFRARRDECLTKSGYQKYKCLYDLLQDIRKALEGEPIGVTPVVKPPPAASTFPWLWVGVGGAAVLGLVITLATVGKK